MSNLVIIEISGRLWSQRNSVNYNVLYREETMPGSPEDIVGNTYPFLVMKTKTIMKMSFSFFLMRTF